jgi:HD-GYP domain-containing protein (c-di-GMP phosphodiesterase class II)
MSHTAPLPLQTPTIGAGDLLVALERHGLAAHSSRVFTLSARVCRRLGIVDRSAGTIALAALYHDVGKLAIPFEVLDRPGPLSRPDRELLREHAVLGDRLLSDCGLDCLGILVRHSHERWDGSGYPEGLAGAHIPRGSRIIAACDTWDAITTDRPYQPARTHDEAIMELLGASGTQLDPDVVAALVTEVTRRGLT